MKKEVTTYEQVAPVHANMPDELDQSFGDGIGKFPKTFPGGSSRPRDPSLPPRHGYVIGPYPFGQLRLGPSAFGPKLLYLSRFHD